MFDVYTIKYMLPDVDKKIARKYISLDQSWSKIVATRNLSASGEKYINDWTTTLNSCQKDDTFLRFIYFLLHGANSTGALK